MPLAGRHLLIALALLALAGLAIALVPPLYSAGAILLLLLVVGLLFLAAGPLEPQPAESLVIIFLMISTAISAVLELPPNPPYHRGGSPLAFCVYPSDIAMLIALAFVILRRTSTPAWTPALRRLLAFGLAWLAVGLVGSAFAAFPMYSLAELARLAKFGLLGLIAYSVVTTRQTWTWLTIGLAALLLGEGVLVVAQSLSDEARTLVIPYIGMKEPFFSGELYRPGGTLGHPNRAGIYFTVAMLFSLANLLPRGRDARDRMLTGFVALSATFGVFAVVRSGSRSAVLALVAGVLAWALFPWFAGRSAVSSGRRVTTVALLVLLLLGGAAAFDVVAERFASVGDDSASVARLDLALTAVEMIKSRPFLGIGLNNFTEVFDRYTHVAIRFYPPYHPVHNIPLLVLAQTGLIGLAAFGLLVFTILKEVWQLARSGEAAREFTRPFVAVLAALLVNAQFDHTVFSNNVLALMAVVFGVLFAGRRLYAEAAAEAGSGA